MVDFALDYVQEYFVDPYKEVDYLEASSDYWVDIVGDDSSSKDEITTEASFILMAASYDLIKEASFHSYSFTFRD